MPILQIEFAFKFSILLFVMHTLNQLITGVDLMLLNKSSPTVQARHLAPAAPGCLFLLSATHDSQESRRLLVALYTTVDEEIGIPASSFTLRC